MYYFFFRLGAIYGALGSYKMPFLLAGCPPILCSLIMILMRRVKDGTNNVITQKINQMEDLNSNQVNLRTTVKDKTTGIENPLSSIKINLVFT